jgi:hypothetical protein
VGGRERPGTSFVQLLIAAAESAQVDGVEHHQSAARRRLSADASARLSAHPRRRNATMNGATTTKRPRLRARGNEWLSHLPSVVVAIAALLAALRLLAVPSVVDRITVQNPTNDNVAVYVTDLKRDGWMAIGIAPPGATTTFAQIIDHGDVWIFRFSAEGERIELQLTRGQLEDDQWRVQVPASLDA